MLALALAGIAGCVKRPYTVTPRDIHEHVPTLRATGTARVEMKPKGTVEIRTDHVFRAEFKPKAHRYVRWALPKKRVNLSIAQLIENCPDVPPFAEDKFRGEKPCLLRETSTKQWLIGERREPNWEAIKIATSTTLMAGALVGLGYCASECDDPGKTASKVTIVGFMLATLPLLALFN